MQDVSQLLLMGGMLAVVGGCAGMLAGLFGVGGGIILVPSFFYVFAALGYDSPQLMQMCVATSLATIIVTSARSVLAHHRQGAVDWAILRGFAPGIVVGAAVGVLVASSLRSEALQAIFGGVAALIGLYMAFGNADWRLGQRLPGPLGRALMSPWIGFLSVLMGIGGGSFGVPTLTLFGVPIHRAVATAAGFGTVIAVPSVIGFFFVTVPNTPPLTLGAVNLPVFGVIICMTILTAPLGAALAHRLDAVRLKRYFGGFLILVALNMLRQALT
ncbi:MAG: sulfite exporter TauE/SafE family protein [Pseudomonadota bacterium]